MSGAESETESSDWTQENLRRLFAAMKETIPKRYIMCAYSKTLGVMDWTKVAFPPFSPEACQGKWAEILKKMRKYRSLPDLIDEAENDLQSEVDKSTEDFVDCPAKRTRARVSARHYMKVCSKRWQNLTDKQKKEHGVRCGVKPLHLDGKEMGTGVSEKSSLDLPSDSEDEDIEYSSSEEEAVNHDSHEGEEEEGDIMFDIY